MSRFAVVESRRLDCIAGMGRIGQAIAVVVVEGFGDCIEPIAKHEISLKR
jgi:hypothetical protein